MKYLKKFNELFIYNDDDDINGKNFILYQENLWIFTDEDYIKYEKEICDKLGLDDKDYIDYWDLESSIKDDRIDVIIGYIDKNTAHITSNDFRHSEHSPDIKKLEKEFKKFNKDIKIVFNHTDYSSEDTNEIPYNIDKTKLKDRVFYHGTNIKYLEEILKTGIRPTEFSNFNVKNFGKIFFTLNIEKAYFHAMHTYERKNYNGHNFPIIIEFNVPDVNKLIPDYDLVVNVYGDHSDEVDKYNYHQTKSYYNDESGYTGGPIENKIGIFGYEGRIPASFIKSIHIDKEAFAIYYLNYEMGFEVEDIEFENFLDWQEYSPNNIKDLYEYAQDVLNDKYGYDEDEDE